MLFESRATSIGDNLFLNVGAGLKLEVSVSRIWLKPDLDPGRLLGGPGPQDFR